MELIWFTLLVSLGINLALFIPAFIYKTDKLTDLSYSITFATLAAILYYNSTQNFLHFLLLFMVLIWAFRLGSYLFVRINKMGRDKRFDNMRDHFHLFIRFWILQAIVVWIVMMSSILFFRGDVSTFGIFSFVGLIIFVFGLSLEWTSDSQKSQFKNNSRNKNKFIETGVWKYSRHPNYFGEFLVWLGIFIFSLQGYSSISFWGVVSPLFIFIVLYFGTGIPPLEKSYEKRFGKKWQDYKKKTPKFVLGFPCGK